MNKNGPLVYLLWVYVQYSGEDLKSWTPQVGESVEWKTIFHKLFVINMASIDKWQG